MIYYVITEDLYKRVGIKSKNTKINKSINVNFNPFFCVCIFVFSKKFSRTLK